MSKRFVLAAVTLAAAGCTQSPTFPKVGNEPVTLSISASSRSFTYGTPDTIRVTIANTLTQIVQLSYASSCQVELFVRNMSGTIVIPSGGKSTCVPVATTLNIPAETSIVRAFIWNGGTAFLPTITTDRVPAGSYFLSAQINALNYSVVGAALKVDVTDQ